MPVTARLSKLFYDRLGEEIANELVNWFNQVDATYRSDLKEVNELNFARFDSKLEQRLAQFESKFEQRLAQLEVTIAHRFSEQNRWMFLCWATLLASNIALWMRH